MGDDIKLDKILRTALKSGASDIHLRAGMRPVFRVEGDLLPLKGTARLTPEHTEKMAKIIASEEEFAEFQETGDLDISYALEASGRFRVNLFLQRGSIGLVLRVIPFSVPPMSELDLPNVVNDIAEKRRGLILVTGATGSGKSTTMASMLSHINNTRTEHIVTVEDPIEYLLDDKKSIISQREIGTDTSSFATAVRAALRQDPDVMMIGELRDYETMEIALTAAETGHLVLSTLHTTEAAEAVNRLVTAFPSHLRDQARKQFATLFQGVIAQRLIPRADGNGRIPATEVMIGTSRIRELIEKEAGTKKLTDEISEGRDRYGMHTFDQSLMDLVNQDLISYEAALKHASNPEDFKLRASGVGSISDSSWKHLDPEEAE